MLEKKWTELCPLKSKLWKWWSKVALYSSSKVHHRAEMEPHWIAVNPSWNFFGIWYRMCKFNTQKYAPSNELHQGNTPKYGTLDDLVRIASFGASGASQLAKDLLKQLHRLSARYTKSDFLNFNPLLSWAGSLTFSSRALATTRPENPYNVKLGDMGCIWFRASFGQGLIFHSTFIGRAQSKNKGRISRWRRPKSSFGGRVAWDWQVKRWNFTGNFGSACL